MLVLRQRIEPAIFRMTLLGDVRMTSLGLHGHVALPGPTSWPCVRDPRGTRPDLLGQQADRKCHDDRGVDRHEEEASKPTVIANATTARTVALIAKVQAANVVNAGAIAARSSSNPRKRHDHPRADRQDHEHRALEKTKPPRRPRSKGLEQKWLRSRSDCSPGRSSRAVSQRGPRSFFRPEIIDFGGPGGPRRPGNLAKR